LRSSVFGRVARGSQRSKRPGDWGIRCDQNKKPMCGIAGVIGIDDGGALVRDMAGALRHRGPDGTGQCSRGARHVSATRLSIIDPSAGVQPVYNETMQICVVFNGEIYNHRELRAELVRKGHTFRTRTDTEILVHLYEEEGDNCVRSLHGMFAFAILDGSRLLLARDRFGIKPLYHAFDAGAQVFAFASEIKAILRYPGFSPTLDIQTLADSLVLSYPVGDHTFFEGVRTLPPGHTMTLSFEGRLRIGEATPYYERASLRRENLDFDQAQACLESLLTSAVETHLAADVEVGLTLSGGIDSGLLGLFASRQAQAPLHTFAVSDHEAHADVVQARQVARMMGATHRTVIMSFEDYLDVIPQMVAGEEQPSSLYGAPFYFLCRQIAEQVKACLHGEGADELFGGYREYVDRSSRTSYIRRRLPLLKRLGVAPSAAALETIHRLSTSGSFEQHLENVFDVNMRDALERQHLLPVDKSAMAASLEMRVPYLDDSVVEFVSRLPIRYLVRHDLGIRKYILRRLALSRFGPDCIDLVLREKLGAPAACVLHLDRFNNVCEEILPDSYVAQHEFAGCFESKRELLLFDMFIEVFMKHRGDSVAMGPALDFLRARAARRGRASPAEVESVARETCPASVSAQ
jgi:asparagine synthase (glutamine-hydrolysing)